MQHALRFLEAVLPANGLRVVASKPPRWSKGLKHTFLATNEEVVKEAAKLDAACITNYIALATYADPEAGRLAANTIELQCLWLDVDYKHYESPEAAAEEVARLYKVIGSPSIRVQSGGGMHAYWVLREPMPTNEWKPLADAFQAAWQALGIHADPISADAARILRIPGTHNFKPEYGEPREVQLEVFEDLTYSADALAKKLGGVAKAKPALPTSVSLPAALRDVNDDLSAGLGHRPAHIGPMVQKCRQVQWAFANQATMIEPQWYATIQLMRHLEDGRRVAHAFSNRHPDYSPDATDAKLAQLESKDVGPTTCEQFKRINPIGCQGCTFNITSPIQLGVKEIEPVDAVVQVTEKIVTDSGEVATIERSERPDVSIPEGFKFDGHTIYKRVKDESTDMWREDPVFEGYLCPVRLVASERNNHATEIQLYIHSKGQPPKRITIPGKSLADKRDLARELTGKGVFFMAKNSSHLLDLLQKMVQEVQSKKRDSAVAEQMGWQDDGTFVVGSTGYRNHAAPLFDLPVPAGTKAVVHNYEPAGSLEAWKATAEVYNRPGAEPYQFALCYGAAGVFLPMTKLSGVVLSLYSQSAGRGKSTAGAGALSWWGNPDGLKSQSKDTNNALFNKASRHKNLPILMDEITDKPTWELEDLIYFMSQGREKESLTSDRTARPILPGWALPVISTSNNSIRSKLMSRRGDAQGLFARIIEVPMDLQYAQEMGYTDRMTLRTGFVENYGHAGPMMVRWALESRDLCASVIDTLTIKLDAAVEGDAAYRFWIASCAAALTVATAARQLGLLNFDIARLMKWTVDTLKSQRQDSETSLASSDDVLAQFLEQNANRVIVSYNRNVGQGSTSPAVWPEDGVHGSQLVGRAELSERALYISMPAFMRFCHEAGFDVSTFIRKAASTIDTVSGQTLMKSPAPIYNNLGRGTKTASARTKCLQFNMLHPALREYASGIDSKIEEVTHIRSVK